MLTNDILRRIRYIFDFNDSKMISLFALADKHITHPQLMSWLKKEDDEEFIKCEDINLALFLNGLITDKRGKQEGKSPRAEQYLPNNTVFMKLKIALNLKAEDILEILKEAGFQVSKHELSAIFRKAGSRQYRECKDQMLRNFLNGLQLKYRDDIDL